MQWLDLPSAENLNLCELVRTDDGIYETIERDCNNFNEFWQAFDGTIYLLDPFCEEECTLIVYPNTNPIDVLLSAVPIGPSRFLLPANAEAGSAGSLYFIDRNQVLIDTTLGQYWMLYSDKVPTYLGSHMAQGSSSLSPDHQWFIVPTPIDSGAWRYSIWNLFEEILIFDGLHEGDKEIVVRFFDHGFIYHVIERAELIEAYYFNYENRNITPLPADLYFDVTPDQDFLCGGSGYVCVYRLDDQETELVFDAVSVILPQ